MVPHRGVELHVWSHASDVSVQHVGDHLGVLGSRFHIDLRRLVLNVRRIVTSPDDELGVELIFEVRSDELDHGFDRLRRRVTAIVTPSSSSLDILRISWS